jgi:hypothetical protein
VDSEPEAIFEPYEEKLAMPGGGAKLPSGQAFLQVLYGDLLQYSRVLHLNFFYGLTEGCRIYISPEDFHLGKFGHNFVIHPCYVVDISSKLSNLKNISW